MLDERHARFRVFDGGATSLDLNPGGQRSECISSNFKAASPPGALALPFSKSQTPCAEMPITTPISASVMPTERRSDMRDAQVFMNPRLRLIGFHGQGQIVTTLRNDGPTMDKPPGRESLLGQRVDHWIKVRGFEYKWFAKEAGYTYSGLMDLIAGKKNQNKSTRTATMAKILGVNAYYLETGEGDPQRLVQEFKPQATDWPFDFDPILVYDLNQNERELLGVKIQKAIQQIRSGRSKARQRQHASEE
jgi:hypothetical protein